MPDLLIFRSNFHYISTKFLCNFKGDFHYLKINSHKHLAKSSSLFISPARVWNQYIDDRVAVICNRDQYRRCDQVPEYFGILFLCHGPVQLASTRSLTQFNPKFQPKIWLSLQHCFLPYSVIRKRFKIGELETNFFTNDSSDEFIQQGSHNREHSASRQSSHADWRNYRCKATHIALYGWRSNS